MVWFILALIVAVLTVSFGSFALSKKLPAMDEPRGDSYARMEWEKKIEAVEDAHSAGKFIWVVGAIVTVIFLCLSIFYIQSSGTVKIITRFGGDVVAADTSIGMGSKAPWDKANNWDMFTRDISLSEPNSDFEPSFENGEITASRIATSVRSGEESGAQVWYDLDVTYDFVTDEDAFDTATLDVEAADFIKLYTKYRDQDRFTRQIIYPELMKAANTIPSEYTTTEFRGAGSVEAADKIADRVNIKLAEYGIHVGVASIKNVDFTDAVEASLSSVEEKQQQEESARADAAAKEVANEQLVKNATAEAEANRILNESPTVEQQIQLNLIKAYDEGTVFVVPEGSKPMVSTAK